MPSPTPAPSSLGTRVVAPRATKPKERRQRNDAMLNTGLSSAKERRIRAAQQKLHDEKTQKGQEFTQGGEGLLDWIDKERAGVIEDIAKIPFTVDTTEENVKSELRAFQMHLNFIDRMKKKAIKEMRIVKRADDKAREDAAAKEDNDV